jgi:hypothetical protein
MSNFSPLDTPHQTFSDRWAELFQSSNKVNIAVGYASNESILYLKRIVELNAPKEVNLCLGMARFDGLFQSQFEAAGDLNNYLNEQGLGQVFVCQQFAFHGKLQVFQRDNKQVAGILGSSNLTNIVPPVGITRGNYEMDVLIEDETSLGELRIFIDKLFREACVPFVQAAGSLKIRSDPNRLMESRFDVAIIDPSTKENIWHSKTRDVFEIPIKTTEKSNLNVFFGEGRRNAQGFVKPRHWYEVEIIVGLDTQRSGMNYPANAEFIAYSDDGYRFVLKTSGDYGKNLRSRDDLTLLGRWIKVLDNYGRHSISLTRTAETETDDSSGEELDVWTIDFSRPSAN